MADAFVCDRSSILGTEAERKDGSERPDGGISSSRAQRNDGSDGAKQQKEHNALQTEAEQDREGTDFDSLKAERYIYSQSQMRCSVFNEKKEKDKR